MTCQRPNCDQPSTHHSVSGGEEIDGWVHLCCHHADMMMAIAALSCTDRADAVTGWLSWLGTHSAQCGHRTEPGDLVGADYLRALIDQHRLETVR